MARAVIQMGGGFANDSSKGKVKGKGNKRNGKAKSSHVTSGPVVSHLDAIVGNADRSLATGTRAAATAIAVARQQVRVRVCDKPRVWVCPSPLTCTRLCVCVFPNDGGN